MSAFGDLDNSQFEEFAKHVNAEIPGGQLKNEVKKSVKNVGESYKRNAEANTPVKTGDLRRSWQLIGPNFAGAEISIELRNSKNYASFV